MFLSIITPEKTLFEGEVEAVFLPGTLGEFEILKGHAPIISSLEKGRIKFRTADSEQSILLNGGFVQVRDERIEVCAEI